MVVGLLTKWAPVAGAVAYLAYAILTDQPSLLAGAFAGLVTAVGHAINAHQTQSMREFFIVPPPARKFKFTSFGK